MKFQDLKIIPPILRALEEEKYQNPTPIQEKAIPSVLAGRDLLGCAQTGTGKTAAFGVPILQLLHGHSSQGNPRAIRALVLTPTRELALQIYESLRSYGKYTGLRTGIVFGGVPQNPQVEVLKQGIDILVATPGRLNDLINQRFVDLRSVEIFVLDEADRMLDMGFIHDVKKIMERTPPSKQTLLFSATMPPEIIKMVNTLLRNPVRVEVSPASSTVDAIEQSIYFVDKANKPNLLSQLLRDPAIVSALVFTRTKHGADKVVRQLLKTGVNAAAIHGNKSQNARQTALNNFKKGTVRVLVATDIAARGLDIEELSHVINYELPNIPETYIHRIGRTGRAGLSGIAISFCNEEELPYLRDIQKLIGKAIPEIKGSGYSMATQGTLPTIQPDSPKDDRSNNRQRPLPARAAGSALPTQTRQPQPQFQRSGQPKVAQQLAQSHTQGLSKVPLEEVGLTYSDFTRSAYDPNNAKPALRPMELKPFELSETPKIQPGLWENRPPSRRRLEAESTKNLPTASPAVQIKVEPIVTPTTATVKQTQGHRHPQNGSPCPKENRRPRSVVASQQDGRFSKSELNDPNNESLMKPYWLKPRFK